MNNRCDLFIFAGESSGDLHGGALLDELCMQQPKLNIAAVAGPRMRRDGVLCLMPMEKFQVMGALDVLIALPKITYLFYSLAHQILKLNPKVAVFIDYTSFSLSMEKYLRKKGFKGQLIQYICPKIWIHGKQRIKKMEKNLDQVLCILPFEEKCFLNSSLQANYVGNPVVNRIEQYIHNDISELRDKTIISFFSGSRSKEILKNFPLYCELIALWHEKHPSFHFALSITHENLIPWMKKKLSKYNLSSSNRIYFIPSQKNYDLMKLSYMAVAKSGTVNLELALHRVPTIVTYAITKLDLLIAEYFFKFSLSTFYSLPNILTQKRVFPELMGPNFTLKNLIAEAEALLDPKNYVLCQKDCDTLKNILGNRQASKESCAHILQKTLSYNSYLNVF